MAVVISVIWTSATSAAASSRAMPRAELPADKAEAAAEGAK